MVPVKDAGQPRARGLSPGIDLLTDGGMQQLRPTLNIHIVYSGCH